MIPPKLYARLTDLYAACLTATQNEALAQQKAIEASMAYNDYADDIGWPWKASQEQLDDFNAAYKTAL